MCSVTYIKKVVVWENKMFLTLFLQCQKSRERHEVLSNNTVPDKFLLPQLRCIFKHICKGFFLRVFSPIQSSALSAEIICSFHFYLKKITCTSHCASALRRLLRCVQRCAYMCDLIVTLENYLSVLSFVKSWIILLQQQCLL